MNLIKRLDIIEERLTPKEKRSAYVATIGVNGKVRLSHAKHDTIHLDSRAGLHQFIAENNLHEMDVIIVDIVNAKGKQPKEL